MFTMFTEGINQDRSRVIFYRLLYNQRSRPLVDSREEAALRDLNAGFTFMIWRLVNVVEKKYNIAL